MGVISFFGCLTVQCSVFLFSFIFYFWGFIVDEL